MMTSSRVFTQNGFGWFALSFLLAFTTIVENANAQSSSKKGTPRQVSDIKVSQISTAQYKQLAEVSVAMWNAQSSVEGMLMQELKPMGDSESVCYENKLLRTCTFLVNNIGNKRHENHLINTYHKDSHETVLSIVSE